MPCGIGWFRRTLALKSAMGRIHLFEWEDLSWFPKSLRDYGTDFLEFLAQKTGLFQPAVPVLSKALKRLETNQIIDLASGGGGALPGLNKELQKEVPGLQITLSDYYPNLSAFKRISNEHANIAFKAEAVDARAVPQELKGLRTQFLSLHHFKPKDARAILQNAVDSGQGIAIFEGQERSIPSVLAMVFSPISLLLSTPFIRPFRWGRLLFTYLIPIVPLFVLWDGVVSSLRTYSVAEMKELIASLRDADHFEWEVAKVKSGPAKVLYLVGLPK